MRSARAASIDDAACLACPIGSDGGCSSAGRAPGCDPGCRGFESRQPPRRWEGRNTLPPFVSPAIPCPPRAPRRQRFLAVDRPGLTSTWACCPRKPTATAVDYGGNSLYAQITRGRSSSGRCSLLRALNACDLHFCPIAPATVPLCLIARSRVGLTLVVMGQQTTAKLPARPSINQAAEHLGVSAMTIRRWIAAGRLSAHRIGPRLIRLDRDELLSFGRRIGGGM